MTDQLIMIAFMLLTGHFVADYGLQTAYVAQNKGSRSGNPHGMQILFAHAAIHGFFVAYFTGSWILGAAEIVAHAILDELKARRLTRYGFDQFAHLLCKALWILLLPLVG